MSIRKRRPSDLTVKLVAQIMTEMRNGKSVDEVCEAVGKSKAVFYKWITQGKREPGTVFDYLLQEYNAFREAGSPRIAFPPIRSYTEPFVPSPTRHPKRK